MAKWINFSMVKDTGKTKVWNVWPKEDGTILGVVKWYGSWRGYAFFPAPNTLFEKTCLRDIADFLEQQNQLHRRPAAELAEPN